MTSREIIELKKEIRRDLANRILKDAFEKLNRFAPLIQDWRFSEQLNELETNYKYMLHYFFEGVEDPERESVYNKLIRSLYELTDDACDELLKIESTGAFYEILRIYENRPKTLDEYHQELSDITMSISVTGLLEDKEDKRSLSVKRERIADDLFNTIFISPRADSKSIKCYQTFLNSIDIATREKCLFISALTLNLFKRFDYLKAQLLMDAIASEDRSVRVRAMVGLVVVLQMYDARWSLYPELKQQLAALDENPKFRTSIYKIIIQLIRSRETEKISQRLTDEIIPEMMKFNKMAGKKLNMEDIMGETEVFDKNPDWQKELDDSGLTKKLQEYSELQMEGADVFHSTFSKLKSYPFFSDMSNWFLPFEASYSEISELFRSDGKNNILHAAIVDSGHMCNSDKYSFCLSLMQISASQREMMLGRMNEESEEIRKMQEEAMGLNPTIDDEVESNQYIQDLYRFFKLNSKRSSFFDIFRLSINFYEKENIAPMISDAKSMKDIATFCFEKNFFEEALKIFKLLAENDGGGDNIWQKIGYCKQMLNDQQGALEAYLKADLISPNKSWILRHIAQLYRGIGKWDEAIEFYQKAEKLTPENLNLELSMGHCFLEKGDYDNALNSYFKVEMLDTKSDRALRPIAWTAFLEGKYELSERYYIRILEKNPTEHDYLNAAHTQLCAKETAKAIELYRHAIEVSSVSEFTQLFNADVKTLIDKGVGKTTIHLLLDQIKYKSM